jgi:drug/metabolite transporter (DMT)-like permease
MLMKNKLVWGALLCAVASISWGAMFPIANDAFQYIDPFYFTIIRYLPVTIILVLLLYFAEGKKAFKTNGKGWLIWFFGTMGFTIYNLFIFWGQNLLGDQGVLLASIMEALAPIISILIVWILYKQKPYLFTVLCIIGAFIGVFFVVTDGNISVLSSAGHFIPLLILFFAAAGWAFYTIGASTFSGWSVLRYSTLSCLYGTITATVVVILASLFGYVEIPTFHQVGLVKYHMVFMILLPGLFALLFWNKGVVALKPINAILFINLAPVTTLIIRLLQGHKVSTFEWLGVGIVCMMIILNNGYHRYKDRKTAILEEKELLAS